MEKRHLNDYQEEKGKGSVNVSNITDKVPFPTGTFISIVISLFSFFFAVNVIYPIVPFMIRDFFNLDEADNNTSSVGYYAGYLDSAFFVGTISSSIIWSRLSDIYGRRPMILIGLFGTSICALLFGLSSNYIIAIFIRYIWGVFDGNIGIIKTILGEIANKTNQARLYSIMGVLGGLGRLFGNLVGGWLNNKNVHFSDKYPYLLPCIVSSLVSFITLIIVFKLLQETNYNFKQNRPRNKQFFGKKTRKIVDFNHPKPNKIKHVIQVTALKFNKKNAKYAKLDKNDEYDDDEDNVDGGSTQLIVRHNVSSDENESDDHDSKDNDSDSDNDEKKQKPKKIKKEGLKPTFYDQIGGKIELKKKKSVYEVFKIHNIWVSTIFYGFLAFLSAGYQSVFVVWVQSSTNDNGLNWSESSIGTVSAVVGPIYVTFQLLFFVKYVKWKGYVSAAKINLSIYLVFILFLPHLGGQILLNQDILVQTVIICIYVSMAFSVRIMCFALSTVFINSSAAPKERATANGIGQTISSLNKIVAPILLTNLFSWSVDFNVWPFSYCLSFYIQALVALFAVFWIHMLPSDNFEELCQQFKSKKKKKKKKKIKHKRQS